MTTWKRLSWCALFCLLSALSSPSAKTPFEGLDFKGILSPKLSPRSCALAIQSLAHVRKPAVSFPWRTFGKSPACVRRFTHRFRDRPHLLAIDLLNNTCHKFPGRCDPRTELFARLSADEMNRRILSGEADGALRAQATEILDFCREVGNANTEFILFVGLESQYTRPVAEHVLQVVADVWPYGLGYNPMHDDGLRGDFVLRLHAPTPHCGRGYFASNDGFALGRGEARGFVEAARRRGCGGVFLYKGAFAGRPGRAFVSPLTRTPIFSSYDLTVVVNAYR